MRHPFLAAAAPALPALRARKRRNTRTLERSTIVGVDLSGRGRLLPVGTNPAAGPARSSEHE